MLTTTCAILNIVLGLVYTSYGTMTAIEMIRNRRTMGFSHFGMAWIAMAFTCGPHHFVHGIHMAFEGQQAGLLDLLVVAFGFPAGVIWFSLRLEAFVGGRGDRFIKGTPIWVAAMPTIFAIYVTALIAALLDLGGQNLTLSVAVWSNVALVVLYTGVGYYCARTQLANHRAMGGWSVSGLALTVVFPTCALMHGVYAYYQATGYYSPDVHNDWIDVLAVPAAVYFLWVVRALSRGAFHDWNGAPGRAKPGGVAGPPSGPQAPEPASAA
jgi:hypothetical protein